MPGRYYPSGSHPRYNSGGNNQRSGGGPPGTTASDGGDRSSTGNANSNTKDNLTENDSSQQQQQQQQLTPESLALARLRQKCISHPLQTCQLTIYVPPHTVGAVIGRGGRTILSVQREAMKRSAGHVAPVRISVIGGGSSSSGGGGGSSSNSATKDNSNRPPPQAREDTSFTSSQGGGASTWNYNEYLTQQQKQKQQGDGHENTADETAEEEEWTPVIIRGDPVGCLSAVRQILPLVDRDHDPDIIFEVPIHRAKHNLLVGKGGLILAALSATYETRIMIPPNEFMSNVDVGGGENFWQKRRQQQQQQQQDAGSAMLFGDNTAASGSSANTTANNPKSTGQSSTTGTGTLPPNVIQLEGDIDKIEQCLVKMLSIVSGERWIPTGVIVEKTEENSGKVGNRNTKKKDTSHADATQAKDTTTSSGNTKGNSKDEGTTAEAVIIKIWTPSSKLLNLGKIRKVQRKTNTVIRRKKLRFTGNINDGSAGGAASALVNEKDVEDVEEDGGEPPLVNEGVDNEDEEEGKDVSATGPRTATKYIITGKTESVKSAAAQFEKILGLDPGSSTITDTTHKTKGHPIPPTSSNIDGEGITKDNASMQQQSVAGSKTDGGESENAGGPGGSGTGGKKIRRKKKRGKGGNNIPKSNAANKDSVDKGDV